jgi:hypothetical protein
MAEIDEKIAESTAKIHAALRDPNVTPGQRSELGRESIRLLSRKLTGGQ